MIDDHQYQELKPAGGRYMLVLASLVVLVVIGAYCAHAMESAGHVITGMNNHVVWGIPHVFALFLILAASGALNAASLASVFGVTHYKPYARLSIAVAISLLVGGLVVLVLDLGRPDRLIVALTHYNFKSIFAWNIFLYTGFILIGIVYLWMLFEPRFRRLSGVVGTLAFVWRLALTTGSGCIFGFLVARGMLDSAILAPLFIALSLALGCAVFGLVVAALSNWVNGVLNARLIASLSRLLFWFLVAIAYFSIVHHLTNLYATEHHADEAHVLIGPLAALFWLGHVLVGVLVPCVLLRPAVHASGARLLAASVCAVVGSLALLYVIIVGSQSTPEQIFPGKIVTASRFGDAGFAAYIPSPWEFGLGIGGVALALLIALVALRVLPFVPILGAESANET